MDEEKRKMKKEILILMLVLCIFSLSFIAGAVVSQTDNNEAFVNSSLHEGISYINSNSQYLDFIARSKYKSLGSEPTLWSSYRQKIYPETGNLEGYGKVFGTLWASGIRITPA